MHPQIREATLNDLDDMMAIYNHAIVNTTAVYTYEPTTLEERRCWFEQKQRAGYPIFVYEQAGRVVGFATYGMFRDWPAYQYTIEHAIYVSPTARRQGIARALLTVLTDTAIAQGYQTMIAGIDAENEGSLKLHEKLGFKAVGTLEKVGYKFDRWLDLTFYQKQLKS
ncbi:GNAT family N-acetyltransferase [Staphylococcus lutrae]|uniref:N-acetyltransferase n=1 Tax=Staphylococcus lutrae TaxID=155085 RepID=A0AAC9WJH0_9STAP|nr:GNAT family N-acetyltransferase [Staphylococcus lutrae]ARJ51299.1 N-acetyltransferase [Staphylococcus lutrae]PNZ37241.1 N-acetyltransferase [Staphylococcus lutrae]